MAATALRIFSLSLISLATHAAPPTTESVPIGMPDVRITCKSEHMTITVESASGQFDGMIYPRGLGRNSSCLSMYSHAFGPITYDLPLSACNTMSSNMEDGTIEYYNTIVVQPHRKLVTSQGKGFHVRCKYTTRDKMITNDINVNMLEPTMLMGTAPMPGCNMIIYQGDHVAQNVKIGEPLTLKVSIDQQQVYSIRLSHCSVSDATNSASQPLIDDEGCSVDPEIMGPFEYSDDGNSAHVEFQAHKFPYTDSVYYHCNVHLCLKTGDGCPPVPDCAAKRAKGASSAEKELLTAETEKLSRKRRRRQSPEEGAPATIEVYSGLYVNEANDLARPDQLDLVEREKTFLDNGNNICISQRNFAIGIAIAGLVLMLLVIAAFVILLARRRGKKDISSGSSIYSGPYTNTAYSHSS
uniref:Cuticlin-1 n=1 Tax=Lygus hesperus TaxID=30085 RepID=A0A0A9VXF5_LYGHE